MLRERNCPLFYRSQRDAKFHADQRPLRGLKVKIIGIFRILNLLILLKNLDKNTSRKSFLHEIWHTCRIEGALSNDAIIIQTEYCFQDHIQSQK
jgi:hypothetical protein